MLLEAKLLLDEVATEVMQDMGEYGWIWGRRRQFVRNE